MNQRPITELKGRWSGADIYVLGSAASMDFVDRDFFRGRIVIGCNHLYRDFPVTYTVAKELSAADIAAAAEVSTVILSRHPYGSTERPEVRLDIPVEYFAFGHRMNHHTCVDWSVLGTDDIVVSYSTITSAMHVAAYMGAANIFLMGVDGGRLNSKINYSNYHSHGDGDEDWYASWVRDITPQTLMLRDKLREHYGCRVFMVSPFLNFSHEGHDFRP